MSEKTSKFQGSVTIRADENLIKSFKSAAESNDRSVSQLFRDFMREYIKKNRQGELQL